MHARADPTSSSPAWAAAATGRFAAILFDLDGTLVDSVAAVERAWSRWRTEEAVPDGVPPFPHGVPARVLVDSVIPLSGRERALQRLEEIETSEADAAVAVLGARELLAVVADARWAIVTSAAASVARARMRAAGLPLPRVFITGDDDITGKPSPEPFELAARRLGVDTAECVALEDSEMGLRSASAAGCAVIRVGTGADATALDSLRIRRDGESLIIETDHLQA